VHRKCEDVGVVCENEGRAIALVNVTIDYQKPPDWTVTLKNSNGDRHIVKNTKPFPAVEEIPQLRALFAAMIVPEIACNDRRTNDIDHGNPSLRTSFAVSSPAISREM
jgi:hypothetical protein